MFADNEIAYLRALSAFSKEIYRRKSGHEKCTYGSDRGRGVKEIYLSADLIERTQICTFYCCTQTGIMNVRQEVRREFRSIGKTIYISA